MQSENQRAFTATICLDLRSFILQSLFLLNSTSEVSFSFFFQILSFIEIAASGVNFKSIRRGISFLKDNKFNITFSVIPSCNKQT